ncbi:MAG: hypothetical protein KDC16_04225 [Saprospiraceae bacterium]|nr:hypothetical protein [Saprospiraceae bacterium]
MSNISAQYNLISKNVKVTESCILIEDSTTIIPGTVNISHSDIIANDIRFNNNIILLRDSICLKLIDSTLLVSYRRFNHNLLNSKFVIDTSQLHTMETVMYIGADLDPFVPKFDNSIILEKDLDYSGSFSRGFSVGNAQSLVLNSNFDLQLNGKLGGGLDIVAAISDDNIPIQPEGNTQIIQDFDRIFIKISKDRTSLTAGDYELKKPYGYFQNYLKKLKGLKGETTISAGGGNWYNSANVAISRGKFARNTLPTKEGNQGPYKLTGNNAERYLQVLSGTEKVYFNGELLVRGFDFDYVIDYNRAEISFSPTRVVKQDSRVIVEFEYTDQNYQRTQYTFNTRHETSKHDFYINFYSEQDSKNATSQIELDSIDRQILANAGDNLNEASRSGIRMVNDETSANQVRYKLEKINPCLLDSSMYKLVFSTNPDSALYTAVFSEVSQGFGSYSIDNQSYINGRVYKYVGCGNGNYLPVVKIVPPELQQMTSVGGEYRFGRTLKINGELSLSNFDINRLSSIDNSDNKGIGFYAGAIYNTSLDSLSNWNLKIDGKLEKVNAEFRVLNPYRSPEFTRDWNIENPEIKKEELLEQVSVDLSFKNKFGVLYGFNKFDRGKDFTGNKHNLSLKYINGKFNFTGNSSLLNTTGETENTDFLRTNFNISQGFKIFIPLKIGFKYDAESNQKSEVNNSALRQGSRAYQSVVSYLETDNLKDFVFKLALNNRDDQYFDANTKSLQNTLRSRQSEFVLGFPVTSYFNINGSMVLRKFEVLKEELATNEKSKNTLLGKLDVNLNAWKKSILINSNYSIGSGQEPKIEYYFEKVQASQGEYIYIGGDADTVAVFNASDFRYDPSNPLANFIRLSLFNNEFIQTDILELNQAIRWEPKLIFASKKKLNFWESGISKLAFNSNLRLVKKQENSNYVSLNPIDFSVNDPNLTSFNAQSIHTIYINRGNVAYDLQLSLKNNDSKNTLISGSESRKIQEKIASGRVNIMRSLDLSMELTKGVKLYESELFFTRNLDINYWKFTPKVSFRPSNNARISASYLYRDAKQLILSKETSFSNQLSMEFNLRSVNKSSFDVTLSYVNVKYNGMPNSSIEYDLLDGLKNGKNYLWNIIFIKRLSKVIDISLNYEGRKTGEVPTVHVARLQLKAGF